MILARWLYARGSRDLLSALTWAMLAWAGPAMGYLLVDAPGPRRLAALALAVLAIALVGSLAAGASFARTLAGVPFACRATALRDKSWRVAFLRQRDPDAAGRPRPRAPGTAPAAA